MGFIQDLYSEAHLAKQLDHVYEQLWPSSIVERKSSMTDQLKGVDFVLRHGEEQPRLVDEKAQLKYLGSRLPTFAFEIGYMKQGEWRPGWFVDPSKKTELYSLITAIQMEKGRLQSCEVTLVDRARLQKVLKRSGVDLDHLQRQARALRLWKAKGRVRIQAVHWSKGHLYRSAHLPEEPVNLVLRLAWLREKGVARSWRYDQGWGAVEKRA